MQKQECYLCGYPSEEYVLFPVPLASPKKEHVVCIECAVDIVDLLDKKVRNESPNEAETQS